jgi:hypothetical protein
MADRLERVGKNFTYIEQPEGDWLQSLREAFLTKNNLAKAADLRFETTLSDHLGGLANPLVRPALVVLRRRLHDRALWTGAPPSALRLVNGLRFE